MEARVEVRAVGPDEPLGAALLHRPLIRQQLLITANDFKSLRCQQELHLVSGLLFLDILYEGPDKLFIAVIVLENITVAYEQPILDLLLHLHLVSLVPEIGLDKVK